VIGVFGVIGRPKQYILACARSSLLATRYCRDSWKIRTLFSYNAGVAISNI